MKLLGYRPTRFGPQFLPITALDLKWLKIPAQWSLTWLAGCLQLCELEGGEHMGTSLLTVIAGKGTRL